MTSLTVLMAVYNGEQYLRQALESILQQTYADFEFLIVNDGSTDRSREIILSYADPRIRLLNNERNLGLSPSLNRGIAEAKGALIARQDADDVSHPQRLARQVSFLQEHPEIALLGTWFCKIDDEGNLLKKGEVPCTVTDIRWSLFFFCPFVHTAVMMRKVVLSEVGPYDESLVYAMDYELWRRIARHRPVANLDDHLVQLRTHAGSMTATWRERAREGCHLRLDTLCALLGWDHLQPATRETRFRHMWALLFADPTVVPLPAVPRTIVEIWRLHRAFCHTYGLSVAQAMQHGQQLLRRRMRQLVLSKLVFEL